ncbi:response regulator [Flavobacteriaceae bacterium Ap0902]|nr:response regulator [Flavobacteriaceae bacterium Ap0902]
MKKRILIVDDEPNIVMTLEYALQKKGYQIFIARNGEEALEIVNREKPDLVFMDVMMPDMDGYETFEKLKTNEKLSHTKLIFLSAKNKPSDIEKGMQLGANDYITKPFSIKKVLKSVENILSI